MRKIALTCLSLVVGSLLIGCGVGNLDQGQVKYTPGVPPWQEKDPTKRGPSGPGNRAPTTTTPPATTSPQNSAQTPPGGLPPGVNAPLRSSDMPGSGK